MLFSIVGTDKPNSLEKRKQVRQRHLDRLDILAQQNRLLVAGPNPYTDGTAGFTGSIIIAQFGSLQDAQNWADSDPYIKADVYDHVDVKPFKKVHPST